MKKQIYDEKNGLSYTLHGDYYLLDLEHRSVKCQYLVLTGKLTEHLNQVDKEAREKVEMLMEQMAEQWDVTEELKTQNQMEWMQRMNNIKTNAEEVVLKENIYL